MPDVYAACDRFEKLGVEFVKKPDGGQLVVVVILLVVSIITQDQ